MGGKSGKDGDSGRSAPNLDPLLQQQAAQSQAVFGATSPLLGGISAQYMNMLGIPYGRTPASGPGGATPGNQFTWGGANGYSFGPTSVPGASGAPGSLLPPNPGTGITSLSRPAVFLPREVNTFADRLDSPSPDAVAQLFDSSRALGLADQFTALPDNVTGFGAAKELAEAQFSRARDDALSQLGGAGGSGAINATIGNLASDRALGLSQVFANLAANEAAARGAGFDRAIGIETGNVGREQQVGLFNTANEFSAEQQNIDRSLATLQNRVNTRNQVNQNNIDRAIGIATGGTNMGLQGTSNAGQLAYQQGALAQQQAATDSAKKGGTGQALGSIVAAKVGRPGV